MKNNALKRKNVIVDENIETVTPKINAVEESKFSKA